MKNLSLFALSALIIGRSPLAASHTHHDLDRTASLAALVFGQTPSTPKGSRNAPRTSSIPTGTWIGGLKSTNQRVLATSLDVTRASRILNVWLRTGELRVFRLEVEQAQGST